MSWPGMQQMIKIRQLVQNLTHSEREEPLLSQPQQQHNTTYTLHCSWLGHENDCANPTAHPPQ